jgi:hypothetical protein
MTKIKTLSTAVLLFAAVAAPVFAQDGVVLGSRFWWEPSSSTNREQSGIPVRTGNRKNSGISKSETTEPGDFAVTDGLSDRSRAWNPTGQVDPGTSNSPGPNSGAE